MNFLKAKSSMADNYSSGGTGMVAEPRGRWRIFEQVWDFGVKSAIFLFLFGTFSIKKEKKIDFNFLDTFHL